MVVDLDLQYCMRSRCSSRANDGTMADTELTDYGILQGMDAENAEEYSGDLSYSSWLLGHHLLTRI
jgi:hypothetical protein